ncbi:MAG: hypothetical protein L0206_01595 [Actinobacteria bacterium]|nr:hypothetical protein [Actinomycetota bacterium]
MDPTIRSIAPEGGGGRTSGRPSMLTAAVLLLSLALLGAACTGVATRQPRTAVTSAVGTGCDPTASTAIPQPTQAQLEAADLGQVPLAPEPARRDLVAAPFSNSTAVTNQLFPIADLDSAILNGQVDGKTFHTETTLLPFTRIIEWTPGQCVRVLVSQYMAFLGGRLQEVAIDLYAQADDGSVWYLGEDVYDYDANGRIVTTEGTWHAGTEGPAAMIMPSDPQIGDANRPENIPGNVFEEVVVTQVDQTFDGPSGPIDGVMVATETHQDGSTTDKVFAPGYGEFLSTDGPDIEALAPASPTDSVPGGVPLELSTISNTADRIFASPLATPAQWRRAERAARGVVESWDAFRAGDVPPRLIEPMDIALDDLTARIEDRDRSKTRGASIALSFASIDLQLRHRPVVEVDAARFELWARRILVDVANGSIGGARGDFVTMEWIRDRFAHTLDVVTRTRLDTLVRDMGTAIFDGDLEATASLARELRDLLRPIV